MIVPHAPSQQMLCLDLSWAVLGLLSALWANWHLNAWQACSNSNMAGFVTQQAGQLRHQRTSFCSLLRAREPGSLASPVETSRPRRTSTDRLPLASTALKPAVIVFHWPCFKLIGPESSAHSRQPAGRSTRVSSEGLQPARMQHAQKRQDCSRASAWAWHEPQLTQPLCQHV